MVDIPKNQKLLVEIKVTLKFDGDRSDRSVAAGLTGVDLPVGPPWNPCRA